MDDAGKFMVIAGVALALFGALFWAGAALGLGKLPGDIAIERGNFRFFFPIVTSIVLSIALTVLLNVAIRLWR